MEPDSRTADWERQVQQYLYNLGEKGRLAGTLQTYRRCLSHFLLAFPAERELSDAALLSWQGELLAAGYCPSTVNTCLSVAGNFLAFLGRRDIAVPQPLDCSGTLQRPELSRAEYLRLLQAAKTEGKERTYLLVKVFALTGLPAQEAGKVTVEAVARGQVEAVSGGVQQLLRIPSLLQKELLDFARRQGIREGPLFRTRTGRPLSRTNITDAIHALSRTAQVPPAKCNPRCLRKLFLETQAAIEEDLRRLAEELYDRMLREEEQTAGWSHDGE